MPKIQGEFIEEAGKEKGRNGKEILTVNSLKNLSIPLAPGDAFAAGIL
jgi:hypothetical protein